MILSCSVNEINKAPVTQPSGKISASSKPVLVNQITSPSSIPQIPERILSSLSELEIKSLKESGIVAPHNKFGFKLFLKFEFISDKLIHRKLNPQDARTQGFFPSYQPVP